MSESKLFPSPSLHQPLHLAHLALQEAVDGNCAAVGVEGEFHNFSKSASSVTIISK